MKKNNLIFLIPFVIMIFTGCNKIEVLDTNAHINSNVTEDTKKAEIIELFSRNYRNNSDYEIDDTLEMTEEEEELYLEKQENEKKQKINEYLSRLPLLDITLHQDQQDTETIKIYKDKANDILIASDGSDEIYWKSLYNTNTLIPNNYTTVINNLREKDWHFTGSITGSETERIDFNNDEYCLSKPNSGYYSMEYHNVSLNSPNIPIGLSFYYDNGKITKIYIKYYKLPYQIGDLSIENINMLREALEIAEIKDFDIIINNLQDNIKTGKDININTQNLSISSLKPIPVYNSINHGTIIVELH